MYVVSFRQQPPCGIWLSGHDNIFFLPRLDPAVCIDQLFRIKDIRADGCIVISACIRVQQGKVIRSHKKRHAFLTSTCQQVHRSSRQGTAKEIVQFRRAFESHRKMETAGIPPFLHFDVFLGIAHPFRKLEPRGRGMTPFDLTYQPGNDSLFVGVTDRHHLLVQSGRPTVHLPFDKRTVRNDFLRLLQQFELPVQVDKEVRRNIFLQLPGQELPQAGNRPYRYLLTC